MSRRPQTVYEADLGLDPTLSRPCQHPGNVWSLHGYHECLQRLGRSAEARDHRPAARVGCSPRRCAGPRVMRVPAGGLISRTGRSRRVITRLQQP